MMSHDEEQNLYDLSVRLHTELCVLGVGDWYVVPFQVGGPAYYETTREDTGVAEWVLESIKRPKQTPYWVHTHPGMAPFLSGVGSGGLSEHNDLRGAWAMWESIGKPYMAVVLGRDGEAVRQRVDGKWLKKNRKPRPWVPPKQRQHGSVIVPGQQTNLRFDPGTWYEMGPGRLNADMPPPNYHDHGRSVMTIDTELGYLIQKYGIISAYDALSKAMKERYGDRR